jgi:hypothetical protein
MHITREQNNIYEYSRNTVWQVTGRAYRTEPHKEIPIERFIFIDTLDNIIYNINKNEYKKFIENKEYNKIAEKLKIPIGKFKINEEDKCVICFNNKYNFLTSCNHTFCIECFMIWYIGHDNKNCSYCMQKIEIEKCCLMKG